MNRADVVATGLRNNGNRFLNRRTLQACDPRDKDFGDLRALRFLQEVTRIGQEVEGRLREAARPLSSPSLGEYGILSTPNEMDRFSPLE